MNSLILPDEAKTRIRTNLGEIEAITCPLIKCAGRILRQGVLADRPFPPFDRSMMDGYALRAAEIGLDGHFQIKIQVPAGSSKTTLGAEPGTCAEIMTGAAVPKDTDCIVPYECTERLDSRRMRLLDPGAHQAGDCIHPCGSDLDQGEILLDPGKLIGGREIAVAASCGYDELEVTKNPSIAIVSTGDELVAVSTQPAPHQIRRSNDMAIETTLARMHLPAQTRAHLPDDPDDSVEQLKALIEDNRIVLISGGISMGKKDFIPAALNQLGLTCHFHGVAQKPGKPMGFWSHATCAVFALPGNPTSTLTCLHYYVIPALFQAMGQTQAPPPQSIRLDKTIKARDDLTIFLPVKLLANNQASPQATQNSGDLVRILSSDGFIELPPSPEKSYPAGKSFDFHPWY
ncbi:MAG: molybdopterin molybdenumtransferase MoeA [Puniceicoccaceae bacterium]|nr:MAG: molybdopterin molybdenumtransferase MoeA [Puniceicoccaceae bacterium]